jgi:hypothetical protein
MAHIDMSLLSIDCFMNDGTLDAMELDRWGRQMGTDGDTH